MIDEGRPSQVLCCDIWNVLDHNLVVQVLPCRRSRMDESSELERGED